MIRYILTILLVCFALGCGCGVARENVFEARQVTVSENTYNYRVYVPKNRTPDKKLPVMLYLHGSGARGEDNELQTRGLDRYIAEDPRRFSFIIVAPQCRPGKFWAGEMTEQALKALDQAVAEFNGDEKRLYLSGYSLGGYGTWHAAALNPGKFAALIPIAGGVVPPFELTPELRALYSGEIITLVTAEDPYKTFAEKIADTPVWIFHGAKDASVPVNEAQKIAAALKAAGRENVNLTVYEDAGHDIVEKPFNDRKLFEWLEKQQIK